ncbi:MAG: ABC transporter permease subunit [Myxococcota bacterium]
MRDVLLVGRFEILRALRTWRALALLVLVSVAMGGGAYLFTRFVHLLENELAGQLGVARTEVPGAMLGELVTSDTYRRLVLQMFEDPTVQDWLLGLHPSALFFFGLSTLLVPFFAATASAETLAIDVQSRAIRFEALRTSRLDLVLGRFLGQLGIMTVAVFVAALVALLVTLAAMVVADPVGLASDIAMFTLRSWAFGAPFVGLGIAASQLTASPAWARVLAVGAVLVTWQLAALGPWMSGELGVPWLGDLLLLGLPQTWLDDLWGPGGEWWVSLVVELALAIVVAVAPLPLFARRNL